MIKINNNINKGLTVTPRPIRAGAARRLSQNVIQETKTQSEDGLKISKNIRLKCSEEFLALTNRYEISNVELLA